MNKPRVGNEVRLHGQEYRVATVGDDGAFWAAPVVEEPSQEVRDKAEDMYTVWGKIVYGVLQPWEEVTPEEEQAWLKLAQTALYWQKKEYDAGVASRWNDYECCCDAGDSGTQTS